MAIIIGTSGVVTGILTLAISPINKRFEDVNRRIDSLERGQRG